MSKSQTFNSNLHTVNNPQVLISDLSDSDNLVFIDVRSPGEFKAGSIPLSKNLPLLSDDERSDIGLLYKIKGQMEAVKQGYNLLEPKIETFQKFFSDKIKKGNKVVVYCARGGMRSNVVVSLMNKLGYDALQLKGGYKAFRRWTLDILESIKIPDLFVLHGKTGVGKTLVLNQLKNSIDLEAIAQHRGSFFGDLGKEPASQKDFEAGLAFRLLAVNLNKPVFIEGESRKIGRIIIPENIFHQLTEGKKILLEATIENRVQRIIEEYIFNEKEWLAKLKSKFSLLKGDLSAKDFMLINQFFDEGNYQECFKLILLNYYDRKYVRYLESISPDFQILADDLESTVRDINSRIISKFDCSQEI